MPRKQKQMEEKKQTIPVPIPEIIKTEPIQIDGEGDVIGALLPKRKSGMFPPKSRALLKKVGNEKVTSLWVERSPISVGRFVNWMTLGYYDKAVRDTQYPHDKMFHLRLIINQKYILEKNQVPNFQEIEKTTMKEMMKVAIPKEFNKTINELIESTIKQMGKQQFSNYNAKYNNCQIFVKNILKYNGLLNPDLNTFIVQNTKKFFEAFPNFLKRIVQKITNAAARIDRLVEGEGVKRKRCPPLMLDNGMAIPDTRCEKKK